MREVRSVVLEVVADGKDRFRLGQGVDCPGQLVAGMPGVFGDVPQALPVLRQVENGLPRKVVLKGRVHQFVAVWVIKVVQGCHQGQEVLRPDEGMGAADVLSVVTPEAFCESGNLGKLFSRQFFPGIRIKDFSGVRVLHGSGEDERWWLFVENDSQDDVAVFDAKREVRAFFENLFRVLTGGDQEMGVDVSGEVGVILLVEWVFGDAPESEGFGSVGGKLERGVKDIGTNDVVNNQDPERVCFQHEKAEIGACRDCLLAGQVPGSGFGQQALEGKEGLNVAGYVQKVVDDGLEVSACSFLRLDQVVVTFRVWIFQKVQVATEYLFVDGGDVGLVRHGCRVSAFRSCQGSLRPRPIRSGAWRRWPEVSDCGWCWGRRGS